jgi:ATP-dependent DNA helicase RecQ
MTGTALPPPSSSPSRREVMQVLVERFGYSAFRPGQEAVLRALFQHRAALAVFPTGAGKSLCYQLPSQLFDGLTLVVSPLIALMKDQIDALAARGIAAARLDSSLTKDEHRDVVDRIKGGSLRLLYVAPERFANERFLQLLQSVPIALFAVDEAHSISEWGHNFRPDYLKLARLAEQLKVQRVLALTATATPAVTAAICERFHIPKEATVVTGFYRPNLTLDVTPVVSSPTPGFPHKDTAVVEALRAAPKGPGIVYVTQQKTAERVAALLSEAGFDARAYHAGLDAERRTAVQDHFMAAAPGDDVIVVATIAFGMGVDKACVRKVVHYDLPKSLESYSQEIGRAGRDGLPSTVHLLACRDDAAILEGFAAGDTPTRAALAGLVHDVLRRGPRFDLDWPALSDTFDLRPTVLRTALTHLELMGLILQGTPYYATYKVKLLVDEATLLSKFPADKRAFVQRVLHSGKKGRSWITVDVDAAADRALDDDAEAARARVVRALEFLEEKGLLTLEVSDVRHRYTRLQERIDEAAVIDTLVQRFEAHEAREIARVKEVMDLITASTCQTHALVGHFGEERPGACGHCAFCRTGRAVVLAPPRPVPDFSTMLDGKAWRGLVGGQAALATPRQQARFLCGLSSPAASKAKLMRHPWFGMLAELRFADVLAWCERQG